MKYREITEMVDGHLIAIEFESKDSYNPQYDTYYGWLNSLPFYKLGEFKDLTESEQMNLSKINIISEKTVTKY